MKRHANPINVLPLGADSVRTTYRHLHDTLLRRDVADTCFYDPELKAVFVDLKGETEYTIVTLGPGHMDDAVTLLLHQRFEEFVVSLNDKNPELKVVVLPKK